MMVAAGVLIYELDLFCRTAQAFDFGNSLTEVSTSATANGTKELVTLNIPSSANANYDGFDDLAWHSLGKYDQSFAFDTPRSETISIHGDELQIVGADARKDGASHHGKDSSLHAKSANDAVNRSDTIYENPRPPSRGIRGIMAVLARQQRRTRRRISSLAQQY